LIVQMKGALKFGAPFLQKALTKQELAVKIVA